MSDTGFAEIINAAQATLLELLQASVQRLTVREMVASQERCMSMVKRLLGELRESDLVTQALASELTDQPRTDMHGRTAYLYAITPAGSRALARYKRLQTFAAHAPTPARTFNYAKTVYGPTSIGYYRNEGNKHILSRGVSC